MFALAQGVDFDRDNVPDSNLLFKRGIVLGVRSSMVSFADCIRTGYSNSDSVIG